MKTTINLKSTLLLTIIVLAACSRLLPHPANFSPIAAMALFGAAHFNKKWLALLIPITATWLSDLYINNVIYHHYYTQFTWFYDGCQWTYSSYLLIGVMAIFVLNKINTTRIVIASISASAIFFLVSNIGCWINSNDYEQSFYGLLNAYAAGMYYLKGTLLGDTFYSLMMFGLYALAQYQFPQLKKLEQ